MAIQNAIPVDFGAFFPAGAFMVGEVERVIEWTDDGQQAGQQHDKLTSKPLWTVRVIDADPNARKGQGEVSVKIASAVEPTPPPEMNGLPFRPVVFDGLTITPYVKEGGGRPRVAFSLRATDMKPAVSPKRGE